MDGTSSSPSLGLAKYNEQKIWPVVAKIIIVDELMFQFVKGKCYKDFFLYLSKKKIF